MDERVKKRAKCCFKVNKYNQSPETYNKAYHYCVKKHYIYVSAYFDKNMIITATIDLTGPQHVMLNLKYNHNLISLDND